MKTPYSIILLLLISTLVFSQTPEAFKYQAVIRDGSGVILANTPVAIKISVLQDSDVGTAVYSETFNEVTSPYGMVDLKLGMGAFHAIDWGAHSYFLKIEVDPDNGTNFTDLGTSQLLSVPYALHALTVQEDMVEDADADPVNELQTISLNGTDLTLSEGGGTVALPSSGGGDNWGTQVVESDATLTGNGTSGAPLEVVGDLTDDQTLSIVGNDLSILDGNTVPLPASPWTRVSSDIYFNAGNVGINTSSPAHRFHVYGNSMFDVGTGTIQIATPGSYPGFIAFDIASTNRRDIVFRPEGIALTASTSPSGPGINDGMYIREGGNVGIQTASTGNYPLMINERTEYGIALSHASSSVLWEIFSSSLGGLYLYRNGSAFRGVFDGATGVYTPVSDRRYKSDIEPLNPTLVNVKKIKASSYTMKSSSSGRREIGLIAQELKGCFPELVYEIQDDKSGKTIYTVNYNGIAVVAVKAIQEQQEIIEQQANTIEAQTQKIEQLERKFELLEKRIRRF
jgi:hypothetical protein